MTRREVLYLLAMFVMACFIMASTGCGGGSNDVPGCVTISTGECVAPSVAAEIRARELEARNLTPMWKLPQANQ